MPYPLLKTHKKDPSRPLLAAALTGKIFICVFRLNLLCSSLHLLCLALLPCTAVNSGSYGSAPSNASQKAAGLLCCQGTAGSHSSHCPLDTQGFFTQSCSLALSPQMVSLQEHLLSKGQQFGLVLFVFHKALSVHSSISDRSHFSINCYIYAPFSFKSTVLLPLIE